MVSTERLTKKDVPGRLFKGTSRNRPLNKDEISVTIKRLKNSDSFCNYWIKSNDSKNMSFFKKRIACRKRWICLTQFTFFQRKWLTEKGKFTLKIGKDATGTDKTIDEDSQFKIRLTKQSNVCRSSFLNGTTNLKQKNNLGFQMVKLIYYNSNQIIFLDTENKQLMKKTDYYKQHTYYNFVE